MGKKTKHKKPLKDLDFEKFADKLNSESEIACVVLGAAMLDAKLEELFRCRLHCCQDELLRNSGPIGTFSARITLARALGWISDEAWLDLDTIRDIRNDFAHNFDHELSFTDQSVSARCGNLQTAKAFIAGFDAAANVADGNLSADTIRAIQATYTTPRWRYELAVDFLRQYLDDPNSTLLEEAHALSAKTR